MAFSDSLLVNNIKNCLKKAYDVNVAITFSTFIDDEEFNEESIISDIQDDEEDFDESLIIQHLCKQHQTIFNSDIQKKELFIKLQDRIYKKTADDDDDKDDEKDDDDLYYGWKPKTTQSFDGYNKKIRVYTNGYCMGPGNLKRDDILFVTLDGSGKKQWENVFLNEELGIDPNVKLYKESILYKAISNGKTIKLYSHDTDPDNQPLLAEFGGKCNIFFYRITEKLKKIKKEKAEKRGKIKKEIEEKEYREWNMSYNGPTWQCFNCCTDNTTRTCSNCYFAEKENRKPTQKDIDQYNKLISKLKEAQSIKSNINEKSFCFAEYIPDTQYGAISINQQQTQFIIKKHENKISHIVGKLGFNKGRHSLKFKYLNMDNYPRSFFGIIFRITLTNKCCADKAGDLFSYKGKKYHNWTFSAKTKEIAIEYSAGEDGLGFECGKFWNSNKKIHEKNNDKYNICQIIVDFDEEWTFCFLNDKLTFHRWKAWGQDLYQYKLMGFNSKPQDGLFYWCFECCAGDWPQPITILHCY